MTDFLNISIHSRGDTLAAIKVRAAEQNLTNAKAAITFIEQAIAAAPAAGSDLSAVSDEDLIDELLGRLVVGREAEDASARADKAEAKLAAIAATLDAAG